MGMRQSNGGEPRHAAMIRELEQGPWPTRHLLLAPRLRERFRDLEQVERDVATAGQLRAGATGPVGGGGRAWLRLSLHTAAVVLLAVATVAVGVPVWVVLWFLVVYGAALLMRSDRR